MYQLCRSSFEKTRTAWLRTSEVQREKINDLTRAIDSKVHISQHSSGSIYSELDKIIRKLCKLLDNPLYKDAVPQLTGSIEAGVKVGLPHEADYLLDISQKKKQSSPIKTRRILAKEIASILTSRKAKSRVFYDLPNWKYIDTTEHKGIPGICVSFKYGKGINCVGTLF